MRDRLCLRKLSSLLLGSKFGCGVLATFDGSYLLNREVC